MSVRTEPLSVLSLLSQGEATGRVMRFERAGRVVRWRITEFGQKRLGPRGTGPWIRAARLVRLDDGSLSQPAGPGQWVAADALTTWHGYRLEAR